MRLDWRLGSGLWCAPVRVTAHAFGSAAGGRVWWAPKVKSRASGGLNSEGVSSRRGWIAAARDGSALLVALGAARRCWAAVAACGRRVFWVPRHVSALRKQTGPVASSRITLAGHRPRSAGHHRPGQLGYARRRGEEPRTQHPCVVRRSTERHGRFAPERPARLPIGARLLAPGYWVSGRFVTATPYRRPMSPSGWPRDQHTGPGGGLFAGPGGGMYTGPGGGASTGPGGGLSAGPGGGLSAGPGGGLSTGPRGGLSTGPGGGLSAGPGGGLSTGPGGGLHTGPGGGLFTGHCERPYRSNQPPRAVLIEHLRRLGMRQYLVYFGISEG